MIKKLLEDLIHTIFPDLCLACSKLPKAAKASFCVECLHKMPYTDHFIIKDNAVTNHLRGRINLVHGAAILYFREGSFVRNMLHQLKYKGRREIGEVMGEIGARKMLESPFYNIPDIIIPVPVHPKKVRKRGYNQSTILLIKSEVVRKITSHHIIFPVLIHPAATLGLEIQVGAGSIITAGCHLTIDILVGEHVLINLNSTIGHDVQIGSYTSIMPGVHISGFVQIEKSVLIGTGASVLQHIQLGEGSRIGAGAIVTRDVNSQTTVIGVPARTKE